MPYYGYISIGYIPDNKILGLSKFKRIVDLITKQLSVQEDLCQQIYDFFIEKLQPKALVVYIEGKHTCALIDEPKMNIQLSPLLTSRNISQKIQWKSICFLKL